MLYLLYLLLFVLVPYNPLLYDRKKVAGDKINADCGGKIVGGNRHNGRHKVEHHVLLHACHRGLILVFVVDRRSAERKVDCPILAGTNQNSQQYVVGGKKIQHPKERG